MRLTIITACFNSRATIGDAMASVRAQTWPDLEHIIVDGGSTDGTLDVVRDNGERVSRLVSEPDRGIFDALNKGLAMATGEAIGFLHSDDLYAHDRVLEDVARALDEGGADSVHGDLLYISRDRSKVVRYWRSAPHRPGLFLWGWMPPHPALFIRRRVYERFGGFDLRLRSAADYELMLRFLHRHGISNRYVPEVFVCMRVGGNSNRSLKNRWRGNREDRRAWELNGLTPYPFTALLKPIRKIPQYLIKPAYDHIGPLGSAGS